MTSEQEIAAIAPCATCNLPAKHGAPMTPGRHTVWCDTLGCPIVSADGPDAKVLSIAEWNTRGA